ncbi:MAG TPA: hypothetical protein VEL51_24445 [Vicinamibacterales bacterium]|nr:hypothetical protein [Vicinamibacterales bacterium]
MTIAVGILTGSGAVIAADTEETYGGYVKVEAQKLDLHHVWEKGQPRSLVMGGSGSAGYIESLSQALWNTFDHEAGTMNQARLEAKWSDQIGRFYKKHVIPFGEAWAENHQLEVDLILAYYLNSRPRLLSTYKTTITAHDHFVAVGAGSAYAISLLNKLHTWDLSLGAATRLAAWAVYRTKTFVPSCGKGTQIFTIGPLEVEEIRENQVREWELWFEQLAAFENQIIRYGLGAELDADGSIGKKFSVSARTLHLKFMESAYALLHTGDTPKAAPKKAATPRARR